MTDDGNDDAPTVTHAEPPLPEVAFTVINPLVSLVLRSPLHGLVSDSVLLLTFEGRRTGSEYTTPVGYRQEGETLYVTTHSPWWRNLEGGQPVTVRLRGERRRGIATPTTDPDVVTEHVREYLEEHGLDSTAQVGVVVEGDEVPDDETLREGVEGTVLIEIDLSAEAE